MPEIDFTRSILEDDDEDDYEILPLRGYQPGR
jgi:hypothetical protein